MEDENLILNTISTISNLLRHGPVHLQTLIDNHIFEKIFQIYTKSSVPDHINFISNMLVKAIKFDQLFFNSYSKLKIKNMIDENLRKGRAETQYIAKLKQLVSK